MQVSTRSPGQLFATAFGVVYLIVGIVGIFVASEFTGGSGEDELLIFRLNHLHNVIHIALGVGWLLASRNAAWSKTVNMLFGIVLLLVAVLGFTGIDFMHTLLNITDSLDPDNFLHLVTGLLALYFATAGAGTEAPAA